MLRYREWINDEVAMTSHDWPSLPLKEWQETYATLHIWTQIVGKIRMEFTPSLNHWWHTTLYVTPRGLSTSLIPYRQLSFEITFDFIDHQLLVQTAASHVRTMLLRPMSVAQFYRDLMKLLDSLEIDAKINLLPQEVPNPIPFDQDETHKSYEKEYARRHFHLLLQADRLMKKFRSGFVGKCSPVHFFWGSFDMAVTRFSGRAAPAVAGADHATQEAYSQEVSSCGFWPGSGNIENPAFYAYFSPEPSGYASSPLIPSPAFYNPPTKGYVLMYDEVKKAKDPDRLVLDFFQSTYEVGADLGEWNRGSLERS